MVVIRPRPWPTRPVNFTKLIPELADWNHRDGIPIGAWLYHTGDYQLAIAFSELFWPQFVEHEDCVFFADFSLDSYRGFMEQCHGDRASVERVMNHRHFTGSVQLRLRNGRAASLPGGVLKDVWQTKLSRDFPARRFEVVLDRPDDPDDLLEWIVTFWQPANQPGG